MINIAIRADSSHQIGIGHVMRCITLAKEIETQMEARIVFLCREANRSIASKILDAGFEYFEMNSGVDNVESSLKHGTWLRATQKVDAVEFKTILNKNGIDFLDLIIVDHYGIDQLWHRSVNKITKKLLVIDDLGDRPLDCNYLLDQTFGCKPEKYLPLVSLHCKLLLGTEFALLRSEFKELPLVKHSSNVLLVMFGGTDPDNLTLKTLKITSQMKVFDEVSVVLNDTAKHLDEIIEFCSSSESISLHISPSNIAQLMSNSILAVGAAGTTSWERCAAGLPTVVVIQAFNQREIAFNLQEAGVINFIETESIGTKLLTKINEWLATLGRHNDIREKCQTICDGKGTENVVKEIFNDI